MMQPSIPSAACACKALISAREETPPEAITLTPLALASSAVASTFTPESIPSLLISVKIICSTPTAAIFFANSTAPIPPIMPQPSTATSPFLASIPTTTWPGNFWQASRTSSGSRTATDPKITRVTPSASIFSILANVRIPPPTCTGILTLAKILLITSVLLL
ncbi:hypothetical protein SDC9_180355 [bioreactor metagenome]|uniref:Uncharacterized protein n=1 Tax=bioreactor metagenome TaxID=1076179 RepID=A0A645H3H4_9ZZZZ